MSKADELVEILEGKESIAIVCHENPDPDCIASGLALKKIAEEIGLDGGLFYSGEVTHQQNRALVTLMDIEMTKLGENLDELDSFDVISLVDHSIKEQNNDIPEDVDTDIVIDHHLPDEEKIEAKFIDVREEFGATTTILVEYLQELEIEPDEDLATSLLFAIRSETLGFLKGVTSRDYCAAKYLHPISNEDLLREAQQAVFSPSTLDTIGKAIANREVRASSLVSCVTRTSEGDSIPQAADYLMNLEGVSTTLVFGIVEDQIRISARSDDSRVNLDSVMREAFQEDGKAGGHKDRAGAQIPLGIFGELEEEGKLTELVEEVVKERFFKAMNLEDEE